MKSLIPFSRKNKKHISKCRLLKFVPRGLIVKPRFCSRVGVLNSALSFIVVVRPMFYY